MDIKGTYTEHAIVLGILCRDTRSLTWVYSEFFLPFLGKGLYSLCWLSCSWYPEWRLPASS